MLINGWEEVIELWKLIFPSRMYDELKEFLFEAVPRENGCFLLAHQYGAKNGKKVILVTGLVRPDASSWNYTTEHSLGPSSSFINQATVLADRSDSSLIFVHTHPSSFHPPRFSEIDEQSNKRLFANLTEIIPQRPLSSLVLSNDGIYGVVFDGGRVEPISKFEISGKVLSELRNAVGEQDLSEISSMYDRQVKVTGRTGQKKLQEMTVSIVGVGGTGSALAVQLARMGIAKLRLIDMDAIDETNVPRVYGSKERDIGKSKVGVVKKHLASFSKVAVEALKADISENAIVPDLVDSDVIFGCTDNLTSRAILNDISIRYYVPLIDVGARITLNKDSSVDQAVVKVQVVTPDTACLWCTGTLDGKIILQESLSSEEKRKLASEGYYDDVGKQPSIISVTTLAASMAVNKLLNLIGVFDGNYDSRTQIELNNSYMINDEPEISSNCVCQKRRGKGASRGVA